MPSGPILLHIVSDECFKYLKGSGSWVEVASASCVCFVSEDAAVEIIPIFRFCHFVGIPGNRPPFPDQYLLFHLPPHYHKWLLSGMTRTLNELFEISYHLKTRKFVLLVVILTWQLFIMPKAVKPSRFVKVWMIWLLIIPGKDAFMLALQLHHFTLAYRNECFNESLKEWKWAINQSSRAKKEPFTYIGGSTGNIEHSIHQELSRCKKKVPKILTWRSFRVWLRTI